MRLRTLALPLLLVAVISASAYPQVGFKRERAIAMLEMVKSDLKNNYYDRNFHGVNIDAKFAEAKQRIQGVDSLNRAFGIIADTLDALQDSHTFFIPPPRPYKLDYGFRSAVIGDNCYVTQVRAETDAAKAGLKPGDMIVSINDHPALRSVFWKLEYYYYALSPQPELHLEIVSSDGTRRQLTVKAEVEQRKHSLNLQDLREIDAILDDPDVQRQARYAELGEDVLVVKLKSFLLDAGTIDTISSKANKERVVIFDLRENPGGSVDSLRELLRRLFEKDVLIDTRVTRGGQKTEMAKGFGGRAYQGKIIVLIDSHSASAAELFARVIQLNHRGTIVGDRSAGKVMEARVYTEQDGIDTFTIFGVSVTDANLLMSDGQSLENNGVVPDELMLPSGADLASGRDPVLAHAAELAGAKLTPEAAGKLLPFEWPKNPFAQ